jgi:hypothetical protein
MASTQLATDLARRDDHDIGQILAVNTSEYGSDDILATREDFFWRYDQNPAGQGVIPVIRNRRGDVVGFIWLVPIRIRIKGQDCSVAIGTNLVIQPEYRRTFGYVKLLRQFECAVRDHDIPLHFSFVSEENYKQLRLNRPRTAFTVPLLAKPLDYDALARDYFTSKWKRFIGSRAGWLLSPLFREKPFLKRNNEITIRAIEQFDGDFDEFWRHVQDNYPVMVVRDRAFLAWRFAPVSRRRYHILVAQLRGQMLGYTVIRCATVRGIKTGLILDLLVADGPLGMEAGMYLMAQAEAFFRTQEMSLMAGLMAPWAKEYRILRRSGHRDVPLAIAPRRSRFAFFVHSASQETLNSLSTRDWFITLADYESH